MLVAASPHRDQKGQSQVTLSGTLYLWPPDGLSAGGGKNRSPVEGGDKGGH